jgi:uncharacterized protein (DUF2249 family)
MTKRRAITLDVREDIKRGREPFSKIMQAVAGLNATEDLLLIAPFEPTPLFGVLGQQGFSHTSKVMESGDCEVLFTRRPQESATAGRVSVGSPATSSRKLAACAGTPTVVVDARGLEPPEPLVKILEAVAALPQGAQLRAHTDRRPMHLYAELEERGFSGETEEQEDGSFVTNVRRLPSAKASGA